MHWFSYVPGVGTSSLLPGGVWARSQESFSNSLLGGSGQPMYASNVYCIFVLESLIKRTIVIRKETADGPV